MPSPVLFAVFLNLSAKRQRPFLELPGRGRNRTNCLWFFVVRKHSSPWLREWLGPDNKDIRLERFEDAGALPADQ